MRNPAFLAEFEKALGLGLADAGRKIATAAKRNTSHPSVAKTVWSSPVNTDTRGPFVVVRYKKGLGPIFESGTVQRFTKKGASRGLVQPGEFALRRARDEVLRRGLNLRRYL